MNSAIDEFAVALVKHVRDVSIQDADSALRRTDPIGKRWNQVLSAGSSRDVLETMIPDVVDMTIARLLGAIDDGIIRISFTASNGDIINLCEAAASSGSMSGSYNGDEGWKESYSSERFVRDFKDLREFFGNAGSP